MSRERDIWDEVKRIIRLYAQAAKGPLGKAVHTASRDVLFLEWLQQELGLKLPETDLFRVAAFIERYLDRLTAADLMILLSKIELPEEPQNTLLSLLRNRRSDSDRRGKVFNLKTIQVICPPRVVVPARRSPRYRGRLGLRALPPFRSGSFRSAK